MNKRKRILIECIIVSIICLIVSIFTLISILKTDNGFDKSEPMNYIAIAYFLLFIVLLIVAIKKLKKM